jgi:very-short-patch-repair endonuclease
MTIVFNKKKGQKKRRYFRKNMPKSEVLLWTKLKNRQMHGERFLRQYGVDQYVLDFYCPRLKLAIEVDGDSHFIHGAEEQDKVRREYIEAFGIRFLRFTNPDVCDNLDGVCQIIYDEIEAMKNWGAETKKKK